MAIIETIVAHTDCLDIRTEHEGTLLISYSNPVDWDNIPYSSLEPAPTFSLRIPGRLNIHDPRFPEENESLDQSNGDIEKLFGSLKKQILLQHDPMPWFMIEKLKHVFKHETITIRGISFTAEEQYEVLPGRLDYPFRKGRIWLTVRGSYKTNVQ